MENYFGNAVINSNILVFYLTNMRSTCSNSCITFQTWYENGQLKSRYIRIDGNKEGLHKKWYENGQLKSECNYFKDLLRGFSCSWYENGQLKSQSVYSKDLLIHPPLEWDENGKLIN